MKNTELLRRHSLLGNGFVNKVNYGKPEYYPNMWMVETRNIIVPEDLSSSGNHNIRLFNKCEFKTIIFDDNVFNINDLSFENDFIKLDKKGAGVNYRVEIYCKIPGVHKIYFDFQKPGVGGLLSNRNIKIIRTPIVLNNDNNVTGNITTGDTANTNLLFKYLIKEVDSIKFKLVKTIKCNMIKVPAGVKDLYIESGYFSEINTSTTPIEEFYYTPVY